MWILTLPDQKLAEEKVLGLGGNGQTKAVQAVEKLPLAQEELWAHRKKRNARPMDAIHLSQYNGTDYVRWMGRCSDGYFRPIGRVLQIVEVQDANA